ncbi:MAG: hypothetical protein LC797_07885 [Chloroflexi bacterium]|nr:hypothetical protein [Chloroflexota bacterium]
MMSSVIPARLVFQCGHAALVSLPRIKGETPTQRADRVTREKSAAQTRACDFCAQRLEVVVQQTAPALPPAPVPTPPLAVPTSRPTVSVPEPPAAVAPAPVVSAPTPPTPTVVLPVAREGKPATLKPVGRPRRLVTPTAHNGRVASYTVRFRVQTVLHAADIRDAVRQAESLGAIELIAITREN